MEINLESLALELPSLTDSVIFEVLTRQEDDVGLDVLLSSASEAESISLAKLCASSCEDKSVGFDDLLPSDFKRFISLGMADLMTAG